MYYYYYYYYKYGHFKISVCYIWRHSEHLLQE